MKFLTILTGLTISILAAAYSVTAAAQEQDNTVTTAATELKTKCNNYPKQPNVPNGMKATMDEMVASQKAIKTYQAEAQNYRSCVDGVVAAWDTQGSADEELVKKKGVAVEFHNRSVQDEEEVANLFNTAIRAYKGKSQ